MSNKGNQLDKNKKIFDFKKLAMITVVVIILVAIAFSIKPQEKLGTTSGTSETADKVKDGDIIIQTKDITEQPRFYPAVMNGTALEVIAVKASDGTIRTAFNTCQVCYSSGRGYYKVENNQLVCQNCGNRFNMDDVEVTRGGCNPVPITSEYKTVTTDTITITKDFLSKATTIFQNWK